MKKWDSQWVKQNHLKSRAFLWFYDKNCIVLADLSDKDKVMLWSVLVKKVKDSNHKY